ncbi:MAG: hypothetical protein FWD80_05340 [Propionibacteriaceae bacterium]|nr:hypothetical protein [Propionibacteriaceae bacterium]
MPNTPFAKTNRRITPPDNAGWWVERVGTEAWLGHTPRGSSVMMATAETGLPNAFTPGDLLKLALIGCAGMSSEGPAARRLGDDYPATIVVEGTEHATEDRYEAFTEHILLDTSSLDAAKRDALVKAMTRAIQTGCTIGLTVQGDVSVTMHIEDAASSQIDD